MTVFERACMPWQGGAPGWFNSELIGPAELGGRARPRQPRPVWQEAALFAAELRAAFRSLR
jgi:hypothetical protein